MKKQIIKRFTFVELIVILSTSALLFILIASVHAQATKEDSSLKCARNLTQIYKGCENYSDANDGNLPWGWRASNKTWDSLIKPFITKQKIFDGFGCPVSDLSGIDKKLKSAIKYRGLRSYTPSSKLMPGYKKDRKQVSFMEISNPSKTFMIGDGTVRFCGSGAGCFISSPNGLVPRHKQRIMTVFADGQTKLVSKNELKENFIH